jgi:hypothetical protein
LIDGNTKKQILFDRLETNGWVLTEETDEHSDWWADEIFKFVSKQSPQGIELYLTLLIDPEHTKPVTAPKHLWAVGVSACYPKDLNDASSIGLIVLGRSFGKDLDGFIDELDSFRSRSR